MSGAIVGGLLGAAAGPIGAIVGEAVGPALRLSGGSDDPGE